MKLAKNMPWWSKVAAKLLLSRLPISYSIWGRIGLFKHGLMEDPEYSVSVFKGHFNRVEFGRKKAGFVVLELGPGDSVATGIIARAFGAETTILVDAGAFVRRDLETYRVLIEYLRSHGYQGMPVEMPDSFDAMLQQFGIRYLTAGLASLREIGSQSVDFVSSTAVYEHIRAGEIEAMTQEVRRVLRADGICSHTIDLKDHLGGGLNNLRFSSSFWEKNWVASAGFYTNRLRCQQLMRLFRSAGFTAELVKEKRWHDLPIRHEHLSTEFREYPPEDLLVSDIDVILRPA